jgi:transposase, IS5 family
MFNASAKGKAPHHYEFGQKVMIATGNRGNWIFGAMLCPGNPFDGHTLAASVTSVEKTTGVSVNQLYVDKGYRRHNYKGEATVHIAGSSNHSVRESMKRNRR